MATNYPTGLDTYTSKLDNASTISASHFNNVQDAIVALETKVGVNNSLVTTSLSYKLDNLIFNNTIAHTITAVHSFSPGVASVPFIIGPNAQAQKVTGLSAENSQLLGGVNLTASVLTMVDDALVDTILATMQGRAHLETTKTFSAANGTSGTEVINVSQYTYSTNKVILPNGLKIQWGVTRIPMEAYVSSKTFAFPEAYAAEPCVIVSIAVIGSADHWQGTCVANTTSVTIYSYNDTHDYYWIAIGR